MLLIAIKPSKDSGIQKQLCEDQVVGLDAKVIVDSWENALKMDCEYLCLLDEMFMVSRFYFKTLLDSFTKNPSYAKLAVVCPAIGLNSWEKKLYGYIISPSSYIPSRIKSSRQKYNVQIAPIPGSVIRRSILHVPADLSDTIAASVQSSLSFWSRGLYCVLDPSVTYFSLEDLDKAPDHQLTLPEKVTRIWKREMVQ